MEADTKSRVVGCVESIFRAVLAILLYLLPAFPVLFVFRLLNITSRVYTGVYSAATSLLTIVIFILADRLLRKSNDSFIVKDKLDATQIISVVVIAMGLVGMVYCYLEFADIIAEYIDSLKEKVVEYEDAMDRFKDVEETAVPLWDSIIYMFSMVILIPLSEELVFRGAVLGSLRRGFKPWTAILLSALVFGIMHGISMHIVYALICGIIMGACYYFTNSIYASFLIHGVFNLIGSCIPFFFDLGFAGSGNIRVGTILTMRYSCIGMMLPAVFAYMLLLTRHRMKTGKYKPVIEAKAEETDEQT